MSANLGEYCPYPLIQIFWCPSITHSLACDLCCFLNGHYRQEGGNNILYMNKWGVIIV